ncbi:MAG: homoserine dehydrogenase [Lachnospiraceae bacterium]|nr:homoserine dehydrogenase [Lachnospiraceae bacterium]
MASVAVLGYGTVGSGVVEVLQKNADEITRKSGVRIDVKYILDIREFPGDPNENAIVHDFAVIESDPEVKVVAEAMGGLHPAYDFTRRALEAGKSVCTSNKELVAEFGTELTQIAAQHGVSYLYEASCGGGIPIIRPLRNALTADVITGLSGIFNGTTNFILTRMEKEGHDYADVLAEAQAMGYAERNPAADVEGYDTCRKLAILASLAYGVQISYKDIRTEGITKVTAADIAYASFLQYKIKLLGISRRSGDRVEAVVLPAMIGCDTPLYAVDDVFNAILVRGNMLDDVMFYGKGAGKLPTGSAVASDVIEAVVSGGKCGILPQGEPAVPVDPETMSYRFFVRIPENTDATQEKVSAVFEDASLINLEEYPQESAFVTGVMTEKEFTEKVAGLGSVTGWIRILPAE